MTKEERAYVKWMICALFIITALRIIARLVENM